MFSNSRSIYIVPVDGVKDSDSIEAVEIDWDYGMAGLLSQPAIVDDKKKAPGFIPATFEQDPEKQVLSPKGHLRWDNNGKDVEALVLDIDDKESLEAVLSIFHDREFFLYPTYSRLAKGEEKYRLIALLDEPVPAKEWKPLVNKVILATGADPMCCNPSRLYFLPCSPKNPLIEYKLIHNPGKPIDRDFFDNVAELHKKKLKDENKPEELKEFLAKTTNDKPVEKVKHFAGDEVKQKRSPPPIIDYSYHGMLGRHMHFIENCLTKGNNHQFVSQVTMKEIGKFGEKTHIESLVKFLYRVFEEYPNKHSGLADRPGNTESEIAHLIMGAAKLAEVDFSNVDESYVRQFTESEIDKYMASARSKARTHRYLKAQKSNVESLWEFPGIIDRRIKRKELTMEESRNELKVRYANEIRQYMRDGNWQFFATSVLRKEISSNQSEDPVAQRRALYQASLFLTHATDMIYQNRFKRKIKAEMFQKASDRVARVVSKDLLADKDPDAMSEEERKGLAESVRKMERNLMVSFQEGMLSMNNLEPAQKQTLNRSMA